MKYELPELSYGYDALEPYIDKMTMEIHYTKHHQAYTDKLNGVLEKYPEIADKQLEDLMRSFATLPLAEADKVVFKNHGGGYLNHTFFWSIMGPQKQIDTVLVKEIEKTFESVDAFKELFSTTAANHFGSGWAWLVRDDQGKLLVYSTANQDSPFMQGHAPLIGLDVWEHAYYLKYQNRRSEYIKNFWNVLKLL